MQLSVSVHEKSTPVPNDPDSHVTYYQVDIDGDGGCFHDFFVLLDAAQRWAVDVLVSQYDFTTSQARLIVDAYTAARVVYEYNGAMPILSEVS